MVVPVLQSYLYFVLAMPCLTSCSFKVLGEELLLLVEVVAEAGIDAACVRASEGRKRRSARRGLFQCIRVVKHAQDVELLSPCPGNQLRSIVLLALLDATFKVALEGFVTPRAGSRVADGGEGRGGLVLLVSLLEVEGQGAVTTHAVSSDGGTAEVDGELSFLQGGGDLGHDVRVHLGVGRGRRGSS